MADTASLVVRVRADGVRATSNELDGLSNSSRTASKATDLLKASVIGLTGALSARQVIAYADAWTTVTNKITNHVKANESLIQVQDRVFKLSQDTRSSLQGTATLYGRLAAATGDYVKEGRTLEGLVSNINMAMQVSGATTAEAEGALVQLSQAFGAGALRGEEFNSVNEAAPRLMKALADSLGVARGELKSMAADGKLTTEVLMKAWGEQSKLTSQIQKEFSNLTATASANLTVAENNLTKWIGTNSAAISITNAYGQAAIGLSENLDTLANAGILVAGVIGGRVAGAIATATAAKISSAAASHQLSAAELSGANAAYASATAEMALLKAQNATWAQRIKNTQSEAMAARFRTQLAANTAQLVTLESSLAMAASRVAVAQTAAATGTRLFAGSMALLGGPLGVAIAAATAISLFSSSANSAADPTKELSDRVRQLTSDFKQLSVARVDETISDVAAQIENLNARLNIARQGAADGAIMPQAIFDKLDAQLAEANSNMDKLQRKRAEIMKGGAAPEDIQFPVQQGEGESKDDKRRAEAAAKREIAEKEQAQRYLDRLAQDNMTEIELIRAQEEEKIAIVAGYREKGLISEQEQQAAITEIHSTALDERVALEEDAMKRLDDVNQKLFDEQIRAQKEKEAARQKTIDDGIGAQRDMTGDLKSVLGEQNALYKASAIVTATIQTYQAATGAMAAMSAIPIIGPALGIAAAGAAIAAGMAQVAAISGAREQGGYMSAGSAYQMAERGKAEVIVPAGNSRAKTMSQMKDMMGGGGGVASSIVIVNQTTGRIDSVEQEQDSEGRMILTIKELLVSETYDQSSGFSKARRATRGQPGY